MSCDKHARLATIYERYRRELATYISRLVVQPSIAEEIAQESVLRLLQHEHAPEDDAGVRAWLFRVSTNLALDHLRRHGTKRELPLLDARRRAEDDVEFVAASEGLRGSPETHLIAREHLVACFACTLRNLPPPHAAALLLKTVYGFSTEEVADVLGVRFAQVKNWIQAARQELTRIYSTTCALVAQNGVCFQCVELDQYFNGQSRNPMDGATSLDARLRVLQEMQAQPLGPWHARLFELTRDLLQ